MPDTMEASTMTPSMHEMGPSPLGGVATGGETFQTPETSLADIVSPKISEVNNDAAFQDLGVTPDVIEVGPIGSTSTIQLGPARPDGYQPQASVGEEAAPTATIIENNDTSTVDRSVTATTAGATAPSEANPGFVDGQEDTLPAPNSATSTPPPPPPLGPDGSAIAAAGGAEDAAKSTPPESITINTPVDGLRTADSPPPAVEITEIGDTPTANAVQEHLNENRVDATPAASGTETQAEAGAPVITTETVTPTTTPEVPAPSVTETSQQRRTELQAKAREGKTTPAENEELNTLNSEANKVKEQEDLKNKLANGDPLTKEELAKVNESNGGKALEKAVSPYTGFEQQRLDALQAERDANGGEFTTSQKAKYAELSDIKKLGELKDRVNNGEALTGQDEAEYFRIQGKLDKERPREELQKEATTLGEKMCKDLAEGKPLNPQEVARFQSMRIQEALLTNGLSPEDAKLIVEKIGSAEFGGSKARKETRVEAETKRLLQELMIMRFQLLAVPQRLEAFRKQRAKLREEVRAMDTGPELTLEKEQIKSQKLSQIAGLKGQIGQIKQAGLRYSRDYFDKMTIVRRKLGVSTKLEAILEFAGSKIYYGATTAAMEAGSLVDRE